MYVYLYSYLYLYLHERFSIFMDINPLNPDIFPYIPNKSHHENQGFASAQ